MSGTLSHPCEVIGLARDWADVRINLSLAEVLPHLLKALAREWTVVDEDGVVLEEGPGDVTVKLAPFRPLARFGYQTGFTLEHSPVSGSLKIMAEHPSAMGWVFLSGTQGFSSFVIDLEAQLSGIDKLRYPSEANRIDWAVDFIFPHTLSDELFAVSNLVCDGYRGGLRRYFEGTPDRGRTFYFGWDKPKEATRKRNATMPTVTARLYQKGFEQGARLDWPEGPDPDWWRFEVMARPDSAEPARALLHADPDSVLGSRKWSMDMLGKIGYDGTAGGWRPDSWKTKAKQIEENKRKAFHMRTLAHMADQYRNAALDLSDLVGRDAVERMILDALFTPRPAKDAAERVRPGDALRRRADQHWVDALDPRFCGAPRPGELN